MENKEFTKEDLEMGMIVEIRNGDKYLVLKGNMETSIHSLQDIILVPKNDKKQKNDIITGAEYNKHLMCLKYPIFDITVGPATAKPATESKELNYFRVPGSAIFKRTFTVLHFSGEENNRILTIAFFNAEGGVEFKHVITLKSISESES